MWLFFPGDRWRWAILLAALALTLTIATAALAQPADLSSAKKAIDRGNALYLSTLEKGDSDGFAALYAPDGMQLPSGQSPIIRGRKAIAFSTAADAQTTKYTGGWIKTAHIAVSGDNAYETGSYLFTYVSAGKRGSLKGRYFVVWQRQAGGNYLILVDSGFPAASP